MPIHPTKPSIPENLKPKVAVLRDLMDATITNMRDKPVVNVRITGIQRIAPLWVLRGRFKEDFAYEKGFITVIFESSSESYEIQDLVIVPGFEE